jgi:hypothetical protein
MSRAPGQRARAIVRRLRLRTLVILGALSVATAYLGRTLGLHDPVFLTSELLLLVAILVISRSVLPVVDRHERGASGEEHVGTQLQALVDSGWCVIHEAGFGHGDVDHLLIGPAGLFALETKSHPGPIKVRSIHGATIQQVRAEQRVVERITGEPVEPMLIYSRAWVDRPLACRKGVRVVPARMLVPYLKRQQPRLSDDEVRRAHRRVLAALATERTRQTGSLVRPRAGARGSHRSGRRPSGRDVA